MENETTTATTPADDGAAVNAAQPAEPAAQAAASQPTEPQTNAPAAAEPVESDNLAWLKNKGIDPSDPEAVTKVAEMYRNAEKAMHQSTAKASELEKTVLGGTKQAIDEAAANGTADTAEIALARVAALELQNTVNGFWAENPDAKQHEQAMVALVNERPEIGQLVRQGALSISDLHAMVKGSNPATETEAKTQGAQEALQQLANKQTAAAVPGAATTSAMTPPTGDRLMDLWSKK